MLNGDFFRLRQEASECVYIPSESGKDKNKFIYQIILHNQKNYSENNTNKLKLKKIETDYHNLITLNIFTSNFIGLK